MEDLSEQAIRTNCPHCDPTSQAFTYLLEETENFSIVCDAHPLEEGHILIIPKQHISCIAEYSENLYEEFLGLYKKFSEFIKNIYGSVSTFEHGKFGQTVFHSHVHIMPFIGNALDIIPEGKEKLTKIDNLDELKTYFKQDHGYLFFSIGGNMWIVDTAIAAPRFFRDRFAIALGRPERGNWKTMRANKELMEQGKKDDLSTQEKWIHIIKHMNNNLPTFTGPEEIIFKGKFFYIVKQKVNVGDKSFILERVKRSPGERLIIVSPEKKLLLIKEYRPELNDWDIRLPGGKVMDSLEEYEEFLKSGKDIIQKAMEGAKKEAREEVGLIIDEITYFDISYCGLTIQWDMYYLEVTKYHENPEGQQLGLGENITLQWLSIDEAKKLCLDGSIKEDRSAAVLLRYLSK